MNIERERTQRVIEEAQPEKTSGIGGFAVNRVQEIIRWYAENASISAKVEYHPDYVNDFITAVKEDNLIVFMGSHTAWWDIIALSFISREAIGLANEYLPKDRQIKGAVAPFSETIKPKKKKQGKTLDFMLQATLPLLTRNKVYPVYTVTSNDHSKRDEQKNERGFTTDMISMMNDGYRLIDVLYEGSVEGGRKGENGQRQGMRLFQEKAVGNTITLARRVRSSGVLFIPVGIEGGWKVNDPDNRLRFTTSIDGFRAGFLLTRDIRKMDIIKMNVGKPIKSASLEIAELIRQKNWGELNNTMGLALAQLVSPEMRGVYSNRETLERALEIDRMQKEIFRLQQHINSLGQAA